MAESDELFQAHMLDAIRIVRMQGLLKAVLPFTPTVLTVNCHEKLVRWIAERVGWVVAADSRLDRLERCANFNALFSRWEPGNLDLFYGPLAEYIEDPLAWDWRIGFDLIVSDGTLATAGDPGQELVLMRSWAPWVMAAASGEEGIGQEEFISLFEKIIVCDADEDAVIVLGR